jgi:hypothetical protein
VEDRQGDGRQRKVVTTEGQQAGTLQWLYGRQTQVADRQVRQTEERRKAGDRESAGSSLHDAAEKQQADIMQTAERQQAGRQTLCRRQADIMQAAGMQAGGLYAGR